jgi:hypothetical protein
MAIDFETGRANMLALVTWAQEHDAEGKRNEAATRLHLIDQLLFKCLAWPLEDCSPEEAYEGTYTDYSLGRPMRHLVVEAKKEGVYFEVPAALNKTLVSLRR